MIPVIKILHIACINKNYESSKAIHDYDHASLSSAVASDNPIKT